MDDSHAKCNLIKERPDPTTDESKVRVEGPLDLYLVEDPGCAMKGVVKVPSGCAPPPCVSL